MWRVGDSISKRNFPSHLFVILDMERQEIMDCETWSYMGSYFLEPQNGNFNFSKCPSGVLPLVASLRIGCTFPHQSGNDFWNVCPSCVDPRLVRMNCVMLSVSKDCSHLASALNISMGGCGCFFVSVTPKLKIIPMIPIYFSRAWFPQTQLGLLPHDRCKIHKIVSFVWSEK